MATPRTLFDKIWDTHVVADLGAGWSLLHIDRHLLHDLSGGRALAECRVFEAEARHLVLQFGGLTVHFLGRRCELL